jgi:ATP-binding cassette subfamily F protein 3
MLTVSQISKSHGARTLFRDVSFRLLAGRRIALVGGNGVGKTTILEIVVGVQDADSGEVHRPRDLKIGYLPQELTESSEGTVLEEVLSGAGDLVELERQLRELEHGFAEATGPEAERLLDRYGSLQHRYEQLGGYAAESEARRILGGLGFRTEDMDRPLSEMSGGWRMRASLGRLMLAEPDVLVLDEPTNHLDTDSVAWLEQHLAQWPGAILFVSHDRDFIDAVAERVIEVIGGVAHEYVGGFASFVVQREERLATIRAAAANQARQVAETERFIERFRYKATKAKQVQSRVKSLNKLNRIEIPDHRQNVAKFAFPPPPRSARVVVEMDDVAVGYDGDALLEGVNLVIERGDRWGIVGPNGAGKSTLLKLILDHLEPMAGEVKIGANVDVAYFAQHQVDALDLSATVEHEFRRKVGDQPKNRNLRTVLGSFGFRGDAVDRLVGQCSGGERTRLALAEIMCNPVNLLVLDEPTNHLDLPSCDVLEDALDAYPGTVLLVSHDRHLVRNTVDGLIEVRDGQVRVHYEVEEAVLSPRHAELAASGRNGSRGGSRGGSGTASPARAPGSSRGGSVPSASRSGGPPSGYTAAGKSAKDGTGAKGAKRAKGAKATEGSKGSMGSKGPERGSQPKRADERRASAATRHERQQATKPLRKRVEAAERQLGKAEAKIADIQRELATAEVYQDPERVQSLVAALNEQKDRSAEFMSEWESAQSELDAVEARFA